MIFEFMIARDHSVAGPEERFSIALYTPLSYKNTMHFINPLFVRFARIWYRTWLFVYLGPFDFLRVLDGVSDDHSHEPEHAESTQ